MRLARNTVCVITGAGGGIGQAVALALAREGCALALADNNAHNVAATAADAKKAGAGTVSTHAVDVADLAAMTRFRDEVKQAHGRVQLLINNAGVALSGDLEEVSVDDMRWLVDIRESGDYEAERTITAAMMPNSASTATPMATPAPVPAPACPHGRQLER
jgi:NADP-dependent 3-hydroxy acid dehydrogenase YdfG